MKKPHLFWLLIDSARNFSTDEDVRGLPESVVDFAQDAVFFENVVTSAPSTIQSISSMMTSAPSYLLSRSYNNYRGISESFDYFPHQLKEHGYQVHGAIYFKHGREVMSDVFGLIEKKFLPRDLSHRKEVWTNEDIFNLFENIIEKNDWSKPTFCYLHFNVRVDDNISTIIKNTIKGIESSGLMDNSIVLVNSDHGYPMPSRGWDPKQAKKEGWGHDQQLYNDNILTPWVIKYPGSKPANIKEYVSTLDIIPTLSSLMKIPISDKYYGVDLLNNSPDLSLRLHRTDNRYIGQVPAFTSFIKGDRKAIVHIDKKNKSHYDYFDLKNDPIEKSPQPLTAEFTDLQNAIDQNYKKLNQFHFDLLYKKWQVLNENPTVKTAKRIGILLDSSAAFKAIVLSVLTKLFKDKEIFYIDSTDQKDNSFDLIFAVNESEIPWEFDRLKNMANSFKCKKVIYLDNNGEIYENFTKLRLYIDFVKKRAALFKVDKLFVFDLISRVFSKRLLKPVK